MNGRSLLILHGSCFANVDGGVVHFDAETQGTKDVSARSDA